MEKDLRLLFYDYGVNKKYTTEIEYYTKAWENGNADAGTDIGCLFDRGLGVQANLEVDYSHFVKSSEKGNEKALDELKHFKKTLFGWKKI